MRPPSDRVGTEPLKLAVQILEHGAMLPCFKRMLYQWSAELDERPDVAEVDNLVQRYRCDSRAGCVRLIQDKVGDGSAVVGHSSVRDVLFMFYVPDLQLQFNIVRFRRRSARCGRGMRRSEGRADCRVA